MPNLCIIPARAIPLYAAGKLTATDIIVLCSIGEHTDRNGEGCWASSKTLSDKAGIGRSTFFACTDRLITHGLVERESGKDEGRSSTYRVVLDARVSSQRDRGESSQRDTPRPASEIPPSSQPDTPTINDPFNDPSNATSSLKAPPVISDLWYGDTLILTGEYADDWNDFVDKIVAAKGTPRAYAAEMMMAAKGEHGYPKATPQQIGDAVRAYNGNGAEISFRLFKAYLRDALKPKEVRATNGRNGNGFTMIAAKLIQRVRKQRSAQFPQSLNPDWREKLRSDAGLPSDIDSFVSDFGIARFLDEKNDGTLTAQVARALQEINQ